MVTIRDVAKEAGVSAASVSRFYNAPALLAREKYEVIAAAIKKLNYSPNQMGRGLRTMRSGKILVILPTMLNPIYQKILNTIDEACVRCALSVFVCVSGNNPFRERELLGMVVNGFTDGVILLSSMLPAEELRALSERIPLVCALESEAGVDGIGTVSINNELAVREVVQHFIDNGHRRIALISGMNEYDSTEERRRGYLAALTEAGIQTSPEYISDGRYGYASGEKAMSYFLSLGDKRPTAVLALSDAMAIGAIVQAKRSGLIVGRDLAVSGFDDTGIAAEYDPTITSVHQPREQIGQTAFDLLIEAMKTGNKERRVILGHKLLIRESSNFVYKGE
ncbi:MAG: LacI family DNA-binding transcriptional regulator [Eubacteriales bacterium]|nr:LacI family DNA-binding transcriptional regulator [Eubacteriales bacterium]